MADLSRVEAVTEFYQTHPISEKQIIDKLKADGIGLSDLTEDTLQQYDQDHFGGVAANDAIANLAGIDETVQLLDVCCGLGGPARYLAQKYGCHVTGIDLTESRIEGARRLTALTGLDDRVDFVCANALKMPLPDSQFEVVISQEAFCHIPKKDRLIAECVRVLKPGGRLIFTDILATDKTSVATRERLQGEMTFCELGSRESYSRMLENEGCVVVSIENLGKLWEGILVDRLAMYRSLKDSTVERFGSAHFERWDSAYSFFVAQYSTGHLTGGRFLARVGDK